MEPEVQGLPFLTKRESCYSAIPYVLALAVSSWMVWMGVQPWVFDGGLDFKIVGIFMAALGVILICCCVLAFWIFFTEVRGFQFSERRRVRLVRWWFPSLTVESLDLRLKLGCIYRIRAPGEGCLPYVVLKADGHYVPMATQLYELLAQQYGEKGIT